MTQYVYWHAPLWQIAFIITVSFVVLLWLIMRALHDPTISEALAAIEPTLNERPIFYFSRAQGIICLNEPARRLLHEDGNYEKRDHLDALTDAVVESVEEGRLVRQSDWPELDCTLIATPIVEKETEKVTGALAQVIRERPLPIRIPAGNEQVASQNESWLRMGRALRLHPSRPLVQVYRKGQTTKGVETTWQEQSLSHMEGMLLRYFLEHQTQVQASEKLFNVVWPDDEVSDYGLRAEQKDRLRHLIYQTRQQIEPDPRNPQYICTVHGEGYVLYCDTETSD